MPGATKWGGEFLINTTTDDSQRSPTITAQSTGRFVVAWYDHSATDGDLSALPSAPRPSTPTATHRKANSWSIPQSLAVPTITP